MRQTGLKNSRRGFGILPTWPTFLPLLSIPIDHFLLSPEFAVLKTGQGPNIGSDHVPLITELMLQTPRS
jgi:endonuclease/exonuclease/phosphatase (EEP) superfamily protein YafD